MKVDFDTIVELNGHQFKLEAGDRVLINEQSEVINVSEEIEEVREKLTSGLEAVHGIIKQIEKAPKSKRKELTQKRNSIMQELSKLRKKHKELLDKFFGSYNIGNDQRKQLVQSFLNAIDKDEQERNKAARIAEVEGAEGEVGNLETTLAQKQEELNEYLDEYGYKYQNGKWLKLSDDGYEEINGEEENKLEKWQAEIDDMRNKIDELEDEGTSELPPEYEGGDLHVISPEELEGLPPGMEEEDLESARYAEDAAIAAEFYDELRQDGFIPDNLPKTWIAYADLAR